MQTVLTVVTALRLDTIDVAVYVKIKTNDSDVCVVCVDLVRRWPTQTVGGRQ